MIVQYDENGNEIGRIEYNPHIQFARSVYTVDEFIALIPKRKLREIQQAAELNDDINMWLFNLRHITQIDLNNPPTWFIEGLDAMPEDTSISQSQIDQLLER